MAETKLKLSRTVRVVRAGAAYTESRSPKASRSRVAVVSLKCTIKPVFTGQAPVNQDWKNNAPGQNHKTQKVVHAYISNIAEAINGSAK